MPRKVLVVGHDAGRAGGQIVLLHLLRWLTDNYDAAFELVLDEGGDLVPDYRDTLPTTVLPVRYGPLRTVASKHSRLSGDTRFRLRTRLSGFRRGDVDLVYANTITASHLAARFATAAGCPAICHVHELERSIHLANDPDQLRLVLPRFDRFVAASRAVADNLVRNHGIDPSAIVVVNEGIPTDGPPPDPADLDAVRAELAIPPDAFVVGGSGTADWRKAPEIFLLVAKALADRHLARPVRFVWVGGNAEELARVRYDIERLGLGGVVQLPGTLTDPGRVFSLFDVFLLTSREDPFPLVCLEAAALATPIVCFADAGGMPEFVEDDAGFVVPYLDIEATADRLAALAGSEEARRERGARAREKVAERASIEVVGPRIAALLDEYLG